MGKKEKFGPFMIWGKNENFMLFIVGSSKGSSLEL